MIIKHADDKSTDIDTLQSLLAHPSATPEVRKRIEQEVRNIKAGVRGESEATQEMKVRYGESRNWAIIHDLRVEFGDLVAQIDHLVINRWLDIWVCESKHFSEGVAINNHGEFTAFFNHKPYGVPSPIEQNERHILILKRILDAGMVDLPKRLGFTIKPDLKSLVLVSKGARISRPEVKIDGIECVIKNDQFFKHVDKAVDENGILATAKIIGSDTLENVATRIARLHKPIRFDWLAKFGLNKLPHRPIPTGKPPRTMKSRPFDGLQAGKWARPSHPPIANVACDLPLAGRLLFGLLRTNLTRRALATHFTLTGFPDKNCKLPVDNAGQINENHSHYDLA
ncbi:MAG: nuclease-related domain-containing protein [Betaproteobacteria bacterium]|nr:nuclease-related domain-containing protein [Betaproteobacteria bacterium]